MNIVYVTSARIPSERAYSYAILKLCEEWGKAGHTVTLIAPERKHGLQTDPYAYHDVKRTFLLKKIPTTDMVGERSSLGWIRFAFDLVSFVFSLKRINFEPQTVIYTREYLLALVLPRANLFLEMHTLPNKGYLLVRALRHARGIVAISKGVRDELVKLGIAEEKILVAHDGVDVERFVSVHPDRSVWQQFGISPENKVVLYTGHFYDWKGADVLAQAGQTMGAGVHTVLMGGVDKELEEFKKKYGSANVHIIEHQPSAKIPLFLKSADVLVLPNSAKAAISRVHASPLKLFEYMAAEVPIVASDVPSLREVLSEHEAFFFAPDDAPDLASTLKKAFSGKEKACRAAEVVKKYTWQERARLIATFFKKA